MKYLIFSRERTTSMAFWWNPNRHGYTSNIEKAGRFSDEQAREIVADSMGQELMISESDLDRLRTGSMVSMLKDGVMQEIERFGAENFRQS